MNQIVHSEYNELNYWFDTKFRILGWSWCKKYLQDHKLDKESQDSVSGLHEGPFWYGYGSISWFFVGNHVSE